MASLGKWQYRVESGCYIREDGKILTAEYVEKKLKRNVIIVVKNISQMV